MEIDTFHLFTLRQDETEFNFWELKIINLSIPLEGMEGCKAGKVSEE